MSRLSLLTLILIIFISSALGQVSTNSTQSNRIIGKQLSSVFRRPRVRPDPMPDPGPPAMPCPAVSDGQCPIPICTEAMCPIPPGCPQIACPPPVPTTRLPPLPTKSPAEDVPHCHVPNNLLNFYTSQVDDVHSLNRQSQGVFTNPFASDLQEEYQDIPGRISQKILDISGGQNRCNIYTVANLMKDHPSMNYNFWLKGFYHIVLARPELKDNMEEDPLNMITGFFGQSPPSPACHAAVCPRSECVGRQGSSSNVEDTLWYFREDLGLNRYHFTWHAMHPYAKNCTIMGAHKCHADRRGELFYYFHRHLLARYNTERMTHGIPPVSPLQFGNNVFINPGYAPNYEGFVSRRSGSQLPKDLSSKSQWEFPKFLQQIRSVEEGVENYYHLRARSGRHAIDELGNIVEASSLSPDSARFGSIHNKGHMVLASIGTYGRLTPPPTVIANELTALRDPIFYQWHGFIDSLFEKHKDKLPSYNVNGGDFPLSWATINAGQLSVSTLGSSSTPNSLHTFWRERVYPPEEPGKKPECRQHLDHDDFTFNLKISNNGPMPVTGTVRIFLARSRDHEGQPLTLEQQQKFTFVLDIFNTLLRPGENTISRKSAWLSTVAPRWNDADLQRNKGFSSTDEIACGCGHPHNLLLPKGNDCGGEEFDLIVIVTENSKYPFKYSENPEAPCISPPVICGVLDPNYEELYVDTALPIGYPFDRKFPREFGTIEALADQVSNMIVTKIKIVHHDVTNQYGMSWVHFPISRVPSTDPRCSTSRRITRGTTTPSTTTIPRECWYDYSGRRHCHHIPTGYNCANYYGQKYCQPTTTATPESWYDYSGRRHYHPVPPGWSCMNYYGLKYCQAATPTPPTPATTPTAPTVCYYDQNMARHCHNPPSSYNCFYSYGNKHCHPPATTEKASTAATPTGCTYDHYGRRHCHDPRNDNEFGHGYAQGTGYSYNYGHGSNHGYGSNNGYGYNNGHWHG